MHPYFLPTIHDSKIKSFSISLIRSDVRFHLFLASWSGGTEAGGGCASRGRCGGSFGGGRGSGTSTGGCLSFVGQSIIRNSRKDTNMEHQQQWININKVDRT